MGMLPQLLLLLLLLLPLLTGDQSARCTQLQLRLTELMPAVPYRHMHIQTYACYSFVTYTRTHGRIQR
jgi:hypothetical protein